MTLGGNVLTINTIATTNAAFGGVISGTGSVVKTGAGLETFSGVNTYRGGTTLAGGTLAVGADANLGATAGGLTFTGGTLEATTGFTSARAVTLDTGGTVQVDGGTLTLSGVVANVGGAGSLTKTGAGTLTLTGAETYTGGTTITAGTLALSGAGSIASSSGVTDNGIFDISAANSPGASIKTLAGTGTVALGGDILTVTAGSTTFSGSIGGTGGFTLAGGTQTLAGANTYSGATTVNAGTLNLTGSLAGTATNVASGATLAGTGTSAGSVTIANGGTLAPGMPGAGNVGTLTVAGLTLNAGATLALDLGTSNAVGGANNDRVQDNGQLTLGGTAAINAGPTFGSGAYRLIDYTGSLTNNGFAVTGLPGGDTAQVQTAIAGQINLVVVGPGGLAQYWDGAGPANDGKIQGGNGTWSATNGNWTSPDGTFNTQWGSSIGIFAGAAGTVTLADNEAFQTLQFSSNGYLVTPAAGAVLTPTGAATLRADAGVTATIAAPMTGSGSITASGSGTIVLTGANTYTGGTAITAGTLQIGNGGTAGSIVGNVIDNATLAFDRADAVAFSGTIAGTGTLAQIGSGTLALSGANTFTGGTTLSAGTITIGANSALGTGALAMAAGTTLGFAPGTNYTIASAITVSGDPFFMTPAGQIDTIGGAISNGTMPGIVEKTGAGTLVLTGANTYSGGTTIQAGTLQIGNGGTTGSIVGNVTNNGTLAFDRSDATTFGGVISGMGAVSQIGTGSTTLTAINTYTGATNVAAGTLLVDGSIASSSGVTVAPGATLGGSGTLPALSVGAGTLAPGATPGAVGTLTVAGNLSFTNASTYAVAVSPAGASLTTATGGATLAGTVAATFQPGGYLTRRYTILTAAGGVTGTFGALAGTNVPAGFDATLEYDAHDAILDLTSAMGTTGLSPNQTHVANALNSYFNRGGALPPGFVTVFGQTGPALASSLSQLSGEGITAAQNVAHRSSDLFVSTITDQTTFYGGVGAPANSIILGEPVSGIRELADAPATSSVAPAQRTRTWRVWATGFGGTETIHGDAASGSNRQASDIYGGSLGVDYQLTPNNLIGVAIGGSDGEFRVPTLATSGSTTGGHVALYDLATFGSFYGQSSASFSYYTNKTYRTALADTEHGTFDSHEFRTRVEVGRHFALGGASITPFAALEIAEFRSNGFTEGTVSGPGTFALNVNGQSAPSVPSFVGARLQQTMLLGNGMILSPTLQVAYVHEFAPQRTQLASFAALPGTTFLVDGARPSANSAQVKVGGELGLRANAALFANFDSEFSGRSQFYAGKAGLKLDW